MIRKVLVLVLICLPLFFIAGGAESAIVNFDTLSTGLSFNTGGSTGIVYYGTVPGSYAGFNWTGWEVISNAEVNRYGNTLSFPSLSNAGYPGDGSHSSVSSAQAFNFLGAYLASFVGGNGAGNSLSVTGYLGLQNIGTQIVSLTNNMVWTSINFQNVDKLEFASNGYYLLDNFTTAAVPIPGAILLFAPGLACLAMIRKKMTLKVV
jgi:hypothetical protein